MSGFYGVNYKINGHRVGVVHALAGEYRVIFERCYEENTLEAVEAIDWQNVKVEQVRTNYPACPLPEGYTFSVKEIEYTKQGYFTVILKTDKQHWGDVTPYQAQIESLIIAKGFTDCVTYMADDTVSVAVSAPAEGLSTADVALISDVVTSQTDYDLSQVRVIEVKAQ